MAETMELFETNVLQWSQNWASRASVLSDGIPHEIGCFSLDRSIGMIPKSRKQLNEYYEPKLGANLGENFQGSFPYVMNCDGGLKSFVQHHAELGIDFSRDDFVTNRGSLARIMGTPALDRRSYEIDAVRIQGGPVFIKSRDTGSESSSKKYIEKRNYFAKKFEALATKTDDQVASSEDAFCSIIRRKIGKNRLLFTAEIDAIEPGKSGGDVIDRYIELKISFMPRTTDAMIGKCRYMIPRYWVQSYLAGVKKIVVGNYCTNGLLTSVERFQTDLLPSIAYHFLEPSKEEWVPDQLKDFLDFVLCKIQTLCSSNIDLTVRLKYIGKEKKLKYYLVLGDTFGEEIAQALITSSQNKNSKRNDCIVI